MSSAHRRHAERGDPRCTLAWLLFCAFLQYIPSALPENIPELTPRCKHGCKSSRKKLSYAAYSVQKVVQFVWLRKVYAAVPLLFWHSFVGSRVSGSQEPLISLLWTQFVACLAGDIWYAEPSLQ